MANRLGLAGLDSRFPAEGVVPAAFLAGLARIYRAGRVPGEFVLSMCSNLRSS